MMRQPDLHNQGSEEPCMVDVLSYGQIAILGQIAQSSNATFLVEVTHNDIQHLAVYKPEYGERPLMDFEPGLYRREMAAYRLSEALGWDIVPTTVLREDGPLGVGSLQLFVEHDPTQHYFVLYAEYPETHHQLRRLALFDLVINNADRKAGHVLQAADHQLWAIDHGLCFAESMKLRTVIWDFAGEPIDEDLLEDLEMLADAVPGDLVDLLTEYEIVALQERITDLLLSRRLPHDPTGMRFPWPLV